MGIEKHRRGCVGRRVPAAAVELQPGTAREQIQPPGVKPPFAAVLQPVLQIPLGLGEPPQPQRPHHQAVEDPSGMILEAVPLGQRERPLEPVTSLLVTGAELRASDIRERVDERLGVA